MTPGPGAMLNGATVLLDVGYDHARRTAMAMTERTADFAGTDVLSATAELRAARAPFALSIAGYIALIASRKRASLVVDYLRGAAFDEPTLDRSCRHRYRGAHRGNRTVIGETMLVRRSIRPQRASETSRNDHSASAAEARDPDLLSDWIANCGE